MIIDLDLESKEKDVARATQADPWVMYFLVKESLGMSRGKTAAQVAHAATMISEYHNKLLKLSYLNEQQANFIECYNIWLNNSFRKIVLSASDDAFEQAKVLELPSLLVKDAGLTEVNPGSETVIVLQPILRSNAPELIKKLKSLK
jgi:peptidyl-tRNA hydrolase